MSTNVSEGTFTETLKRLRERLDKLQESLPEFTDDYHRLFLYFIGEQFEDLSPDRMKICDRQRDQKIDFYNVEEDRFVGYQCKVPDLEILGEKGKIETYGAELVNEAEDILT